ncbi:arginine N-succinyltransferase [Marinobacterium zhoushanense]|uniref:Arginine N-succinyltransferase n=1 Tax=Marinobacterium zhoushanense TaxID=1679163 RepID=A0ABQ1K4Q9_9GAMM|nr:arginine N-succinyltransferase [Marinobacterium zhoushanense]GGB87978.1 arginine N-succinyltransferase [Marinobacterium zhoushanense]
MLIIRPVDFPDLPALEQLAIQSRGSTTTLPANREYLGQLIAQTQASLEKKVSLPGNESYHFVLEESDSGRILGISGIEASIGLDSPFYSYRIDEVVHASRELQIHNRIPSLHLCHDYNGTSRLCTRYLSAEADSPANAHLLSRARMLFIAEYPKRFARRTVVELQGMVDAEGKSPFWECLGRHFFGMDMSQADYLTGINRKTFIAELMPHYPVYVPLLSEAARNAIAQPRPDIEPVMDLLEDEGFEFRGYVDIFDAGPTLEARTDDIRSVWQSQLRTLKVSAQPTDSEQWLLLSNNALSGFRALLVQADAEQPEIKPEVAELLQLKDGDPVRVLPLAADDLLQ